MSFVTKGQSVGSIRDGLIERSFRQSYDYFVGELAVLPTTLTKIRLVNESENMSTPMLRKLWDDLFTIPLNERKNLIKAALMDAWLQLPSLTRQYQDRQVTIYPPEMKEIEVKVENGELPADVQPSLSPIPKDSKMPTNEISISLNEASLRAREEAIIKKRRAKPGPKPKSQPPITEEPK